MKNKRISLLLAGILAIGVLSTGCGKTEDNGSSAGTKTAISVSGSTSIGPSMEKVAEQFEKNNEGISVEIQQIGSSAGIKNVIDGVSEIGMSSRDLKDEEKNAGLQETKIATDGIAVITNKNNKVKNLTKEQVKDIYTGKIKNWKEVGGNDAPIVVVSREEGSGTRDGFQEILGFESTELLKDAQISDGSGNIKSTIEGNENSIGYISFGYVDESINALSIDNAEPTDENVVNSSYPISRPFILVDKQEGLSENGKKLIDFILSDEGQQIMEEEGFIKIN